MSQSQYPDKYPNVSEAFMHFGGPTTTINTPVETKAKTTREAVLDEAKSLVCGDRNAQYGEPYDDFLKIAEALNAYGYSGPGGRKMMPRDIPFFQILVKLSRIVESPLKTDSWVDTAGYAACGAEVAEVEKSKNEQ